MGTLGSKTAGMGPADSMHGRLVTLVTASAAVLATGGLSEVSHCSHGMAVAGDPLGKSTGRLAIPHNASHRIPRHRLHDMRQNTIVGMLWPWVNASTPAPPPPPRLCRAQPAIECASICQRCLHYTP